jgi:hypothetical protein
MFPPTRYRKSGPMQVPVSRTSVDGGEAQGTSPPSTNSLLTTASTAGRRSSGRNGLRLVANLLGLAGTAWRALVHCPAPGPC